MNIGTQFPLELESRILSFGEQVEVLEPDHLREAVGRRLKRALGRYGR